MTEYQFKSEPFPHQAELFARTRELPDYAYFWEQGCGKTKPAIDTAAGLYEAGQIDALVVIAPNGVHRNWVTDELPLHMPDRVAKAMDVDYWQSSKAGNKAHVQRMKTLFSHEGLSVVTVSYDGFMTKAGLEYFGKFFRHRRVMLVVDEGHYIKTPKAVRTKTLIKAGKFASYKRLLTGTPIAQGPFDIYSQINFLDDNFWRTKGISNFSAFKQYFGVWNTRRLGNGRTFEQLVEYKNLDQLTAWIAEKGHRLTKETAGLNLPPKLYSKRYFEMAPEQARAYQELRKTSMLELAGGTVTAQLAMTLLLRLQQVTCGYVTDETGVMHRLDDNPRLDVMNEIADGLSSPAIVWARFTEDINQVVDSLSSKGFSAVRYDGQTSDDERAEAKHRFQKGEVQFFVGNPAAGSTGLTLTKARTVVYYSNSFKLVDRLQSEDRPHRIGQHNAVNYIDLIAEGTVDEKLVASLRTKFDVASQLTGDGLREWI